LGDDIEDLKGSIVQLGLLNNRIYLMRLNTEDTRDLIAALDDMARKNGYAKIFAKIPSPTWKDFQKAASYL